LELARQKNTFERTEVSKADALAYFTEKGDEYKIETINELEDGYQSGESDESRWCILER